MDNLYLNIHFEHDKNYGNAPSPMQTRITREASVVPSPASDYYLGVARFTIPLNTTCLYYPPIVPNQANPNLTSLVVGLSYSGTDFSQSVYYIPQTSIYNAPIQNLDRMVVTPYYFCYEYEQLIQMINIALGNVYATFKAAYPLSQQALANEAPYLVYEPTTQLISLIVHSSFTVTTPGSICQIYLNEQTLNFIDAIPVSQVAQNSPIGKDYIINMPDGNNKEYYGYAKYGTAETSPPTFYRIPQSYPTLSNWTVLRKIFMTSNTIPISNEATQTYNTGTPSSMPILCDFIPEVGSSSESRSIVYYSQSGPFQYRLIDLLTNNDIRSIDISVYWQDKNDNVFPLTLSVLQHASMKIAFVKKSLYKYNKF